MTKIFTKIDYESLNSRQKESYNFQKASAVLADYGFTTILLSDDWNGADFIALRKDVDNKRLQDEALFIQLKGRLTFDKKYMGKNLWVCFRNKEQFYLYPHDELLPEILKIIGRSKSWTVEGGYSFPSLGVAILKLLEPYRI
jgi:hypothetical protein